MTVATDRVRVLVVEDDETIRLSLEAGFREAGYEVLAEAEGTGITKVAEWFRPDVAVLDVRLPDLDGYSVARRLRGVSSIPILFLTSADANEDRLRGFEVGADDYIVKPFWMPEVVARVRVALRRAGRIGPMKITVGDLVIDADAGVVTRGSHVIRLTAMEYRLLTVLAEHRGQLLSKTQILGQVWGFAGLNTNLVEVHMHSLRRKLERHGCRLIHTKRDLGYVLRPPFLPSTSESG